MKNLKELSRQRKQINSELRTCKVEDAQGTLEHLVSENSGRNFLQDN
jgi:hypothetical protein